MNLRFASVADDAPEFIPLLTEEEEKKLFTAEIPPVLPLLPLRNTVLFPGVVIPITVGREKSVRLINEVNSGNKQIGVVAQKDDKIEDPTYDQLYKVGTLALILKVLHMPDGNTTVIIQGKRKFVLEKQIQNEPYITAQVIPFEEENTVPATKEFSALIDSLKDLAMQIVRHSPNIPSEASFAIKNIGNISFLINFISSNLGAPVAEKQQLLEITSLSDRAYRLLGLLTKELQMAEMKHEIQSKAKTGMDQQQREYFLNQQLKQIQEELGGSPIDLALKEMKAKAKNKKWSKQVAATFAKEMDKLQRMHPNMAEHGLQMNYLETLIELPWEEFTKDKFEMRKAERILNRDHYGLEKVKERILEHLAVLKLKGDMKSPILCFVGPPGVGKTSLGKSIAEALGRKYIRVSLGGMRDEAEIRGHRKTYIGAMPGRIMQSIRKAGSSNPVFVLDEVDKISADYHGDPSAALLEVLDPEQNFAFHDNYVELDYDLSRVMFIATANTLANVQPALRDRMEVIDISGYIVEEKIKIATHFLIPRQMKEHGLRTGRIIFSNDVLQKIIEDHTRESGVRHLEKKIAKVMRYSARKIGMREKYNRKLSPDDLTVILGAALSKEKYEENLIPGVVTGLAWTPAGGDIIFIEVSLSKGKGNLTLTGNLGDVMKESATIALEYLKSHSGNFEIDSSVFGKTNVHIHVPEGATPKDGPSAGISMFTALASAFTANRVKPYTAMTGEITLRGKVLPVGGIKEKILAAKRGGITEVILPEENRKDVAEIKPLYLEGLRIHYVKELLETARIMLVSAEPRANVLVEN